MRAPSHRVCILGAALFLLLLVLWGLSRMGLSPGKPEAFAPHVEGMEVGGREGPVQPQVQAPGAPPLRKVEAEGERQVGSSKPRARDAESERQEPEPGRVFGNIVDSQGKRLHQGRVLVFEERRGGSPLAVLELGKPNEQYSIVLPSGKGFWFVVDPTSLWEGVLPPPTRDWVQDTLGDGAKPPDVLPVEACARDFALLQPAEERRLDLEVGRWSQVTGRLLDRDGLALPDVVARISAQSSVLSGLSQDQRTDSAGRFHFEAVYPSMYRLRFFREQPFQPPLPVDFELRGGELRDLGDVRVAVGVKSIRGHVVDQDGRPFGGLPIQCSPDLPVKAGFTPSIVAGALARTTTDEDGFFELRDLPGIPFQVALTPGFPPREVRGAGFPAMWVPNVSVNLEGPQNVLDIGTVSVPESRPFEIKGRVIFAAGWSADGGPRRGRLSIALTEVPGEALPEGLRRVSLRGKRLSLDKETGTFGCLVETPRSGLELRFRLPGFSDLVFSIQARPLESWESEIHVPGDFTPLPKDSSR